ncbi:hypothetical protein CJI97_003148 [Candidozyma auris]|uniref:Importin N-terminal domain-containing protein n=1 Tax=Candidozyma auris TaxID=498019 RepID=A0A2H0ZTJ1_CANAR|nr:hypothetical protein B9J08_003076 [[Candida] auris]PIS53473.1 hypothetical protein CJI97_003148 [[Candida] auris]
MDKETLLKSLAGTLDANPETRKGSEKQLRYFEEQQGFTAYLLDLIADSNISLGVQTSAAIFFKNRVAHFWVVPDSKPATARYIQAQEKNVIKQKLVEVLSQKYKNTQLRVQLSTAISSILNAEKWDDLTNIIPKLISDTSNIDHVFTGLICLFEYTKNYRYSHEGNRNIVLEEVAETIFPLLESLTESLMNNDSNVSDEMLYLVFKIFKYTTYSTLPTYLANPSKLGTWCNLHIMLINKPLPDTVARLEPSERASAPRVKAVKWCFGNLHRLLFRHGGGVSTPKKDSEFATTFLNNFVPEILNVYWQIIEKWSSKSLWLSEASLYHLIAFLEMVIETPDFPLIEEKLDAIIRHILLPTLNANKDTIELYEDDPEEYIRKFFELSRDNTTSDTASINFLFRLSSTKFSKTGATILNIINEIFQKRSGDKENLEYACQTEGALRILATISLKLNKDSSPVKGQVDQLLQSFVLPELSQSVIARYPWLTARACDTIAMFSHKFSDQKILQDIFQAIVFCFQQQDHFPIQLTAVDALKTLVEEDVVAAQVADQAPQLMGVLLDMSKNFESDILNTVMDVFVEKFAANLEPYANELSIRLVEQFLKLAHEILEQSTSSGNINVDKEYSAAGILNTLTSLVVSMSASPHVSSNLELILKDMIKFILENSMASFLSEVMEMLESILLSTNQMSPTMWELYQTVISCFDTYAEDFFDTFQPFLEGVVLYAFADESITVDNANVQSLFNVCFRMLTGDMVDPVFAHQAFELIEFSILTLHKRFIPFLPQFLPEIFKIYQSLEAQEAFDGYMLHYLSVLKIFFACFCVEATGTLEIMKQHEITKSFFSMWVKYSDDFRSVYGCKLQILAALSILLDAPLDLLPTEDLVGEAVDLLFSNLETLPHAIKARQDIIDKESGARGTSKDFNGGDDDDDEDEDYYAEDLEADEAELEALKQTPLDNINSFQIFAEKITQIQEQDLSRYQAVFGNLDASQKEIANRIVQISQRRI